LQLLTGDDWRVFSPLLAVAVLAVLATRGFDAIQRVLEYFVLVLVTFGAATFLARPDWAAVLHGSAVPRASLDPGYVTAAVALLGTTVTSYVYLWQSVEAAEERPRFTRLRSVAVPSAVGIVAAMVIVWFILVATAATLGQHNNRVNTAQEAAQALRPVAGPVAAYLFAIGLLSSALLAVPILAAVTGYMVGALFDWPSGLSKRPREAPRFYLVVAASLGLAVVAVLPGVDPIRLLFGASLAGGVATPVSIGFLVLVARDRRVMGDQRIPRWLAVATWAFAAFIAAISAIFLAQLFAH
jgi:Mn2+/Fe2+ NRAMP family transporter